MQPVAVYLQKYDDSWVNQFHTFATDLRESLRSSMIRNYD